MRFSKVVLIVCLIAGCSNEKVQSTYLFTNVTAQSGISFSNDLTFTKRLNPYTYRNFYNGAGVAVGDINNDGLQDIYFAGNQAGNKLYLNKGDFVFQDITDKAGVACKDVWSTGVTFADINADGLLDIYVCKSGDPQSPNRNNELFINNGDLTFTEQSKEYGLDVVGLSVQAAFFDYDKDGDLDCYLLTNSTKSVGHYDLVKNQRDIPDPNGAGNKFFINENGKFRDYSKEARIYRSNIGFGLGITLGDFNDDSWTDIFVSNDFFERDYLYINDQHGSFNESLTEYFESISMGSMGADLADIDNDGVAELFVTEMLPDSLSRKKTKTVFDSWNKYQLNLESGYYHQFSRNVLQKKTGPGNYVEVGRLAGISASEWSWGALIFDMDNDGMKDIFVANGIYKDLLDRDYLTYSGSAENVRNIIKEEQENAIIKLLDLMPSSEFPNYAFRNEGNLSFKNVASDWGLAVPMFSCGSAYGDFDNDGDLDLVINNINAPSVLYRNNSDSLNYKSITLSLSAKGKNTFAVGSKATAFCGRRKFVSDNFVTRGFQSSVQPVITVGLGEGIKTVDSLLIQWPDYGFTILYDIPVGKKLSIVKENSEVLEANPYEKQVSDVAPFTLQLVDNSIFEHQGSPLVDFNRDRLLPMMYSNESPSMVKGDIDGDGLDEVYVGGGKGQTGTLIRFKPDNSQPPGRELLTLNSMSEETKCALADFDNDGDLDLYMATGGRFFPRTSSALRDQIFLNDGKGTFAESSRSLPFHNFFSTSVTRPFDFDNDGDLDLFVGERFDPFVYGLGGRGYLLQNDGSGLFKDVTEVAAPALLEAGMVTDASVVDFDNDGRKDLVIVGDWMPVIALKNTSDGFIDVSAELGFGDTHGWWHCIESGDFNKDGTPDFVLGNHGMNSFFRNGDRMYVNDFDANGSVEQVFCTKAGEKYFPVVEKDELLSQLPALKKDVLYYREYSRKSIDELFSAAVLEKSSIFEVKLLSSVLFLSDGGSFEKVELPLEAQYSPIYAMLIEDLDNDGIADLIAGGNQYLVKPQFGRYDASHGWFFKGSLVDEKFSFQPGVDLNVKGQIRSIEIVKNRNVTYVLFAKYNDKLEIYKVLFRDPYL